MAREKEQFEKEQLERVYTEVATQVNKGYADFLIEIDTHVIDINTKCLIGVNITKLVRILLTAYELSSNQNATYTYDKLNKLEGVMAMHTPYRLIEIMKMNKISLEYKNGAYQLVNRKRGRNPKDISEVLYNSVMKLSTGV